MFPDWLPTRYAVADAAQSLMCWLLWRQKEMTMGWLVNALCSFDWISPTLASIDDIRNGPGVGFRVPEDAGHSGREIERTLTRQGIRVWGLMIVNDTIIFDVPADEADAAGAILHRAGVDYQGGPR